MIAESRRHSWKLVVAVPGVEKLEVARRSGVFEDANAEIIPENPP